MRVPGGGPVLGAVSPSVRETVNLRLPTMKEHRQDCDKDKRMMSAPLNIFEDRPPVRVPVRVMEMLKRLTALAAQKKKNEDSVADLSQTLEHLSVDEQAVPQTNGKDVETPKPVMSVEQLMYLIFRLTANDKTTEEDLSTTTSKKSDAEKTDVQEGDGSDDDEDDDKDLCSRAPTRRYNGQHVDTSPYANASRRHHSGGACTYAAIDPVASEGYDKSWFASETAQNVVNVAETSFDLSDDDIKRFFNSTPHEYIIDMLEKMYNEYGITDEKMKTNEMPQPVVDMNLVRESNGDWADVRAASSALVTDSLFAYDSGISSSSSSPISIPASSPADSHDYSPRSSPPDDSNQAVPCPDLHDPYTSNAGTFYSPSAATSLHQDFETLDQIASNGYMCGLDSTDVDGLDTLDEGFSQSRADDESSVFSFVPQEFAPDLDQFAGRSSQNATLQRNTFQFVNQTDRSDFPVVEPAAGPTLGLLYPVIPAVRRPATATSGLKPIKPKVNRPAKTSSGRDRLLTMMDEKKKAEAWSKVFSKRKEATECDGDGDTQLMILCANPKCAKDYALEYIYALVEMLKNVPNALSAVNRQNHSALYLAAVHSDYQHRAVVVRYLAETLVEQGVDITQPSARGCSLLHELCSLGDDRHDVIKELLALRDATGKHCFDVNAYDTQGRTALHLAASHMPLIGSPSGKTVQLLIAEGADILLADKVYGHTALHLAILNSCATGLVQALLSAAKSFCPPGDLAQICNSRDANRNTPLHSAASRNDVPLDQQKLMIRMLTDQAHKAGKSMNAHGKYPIMLVAEERRQEIRAVYETRREI